MKKALSLALAAAEGGFSGAAAGLPLHLRPAPLQQRTPAASGAASAGGQTLKVMLSEEPGEGSAFATTLKQVGRRDRQHR